MTCNIFHVFQPNVFNKYLPCIFDFCEIQLIRIFGQRFRHARLISPAKLARNTMNFWVCTDTMPRKRNIDYMDIRSYYVYFIERGRERKEKKSSYIYIYIKIYYFCVIVYYIHVLTIFLLTHIILHYILVFIYITDNYAHIFIPII